MKEITNMISLDLKLWREVIFWRMAKSLLRDPNNYWWECLLAFTRRIFNLPSRPTIWCHRNISFMPHQLFLIQELQTHKWVPVSYLICKMIQFREYMKHWNDVPWSPSLQEELDSAFLKLDHKTATSEGQMESAMV